MWAPPRSNSTKMTSLLTSYFCWENCIYTNLSTFTKYISSSTCSVYSNAKIYWYCQVVCAWPIALKKSKIKVLPQFPAALYLALSLVVGQRRCILQSELISHSRIWSCRQVQIFSMPNFDASAILSDRVFDNSHCVIVTRVNEHRCASDFGAFVGDLSKPVSEYKSVLKLCSVNSALDAQVFCSSFPFFIISLSKYKNKTIFCLKCNSLNNFLFVELLYKINYTFAITHMLIFRKMHSCLCDIT